MKGLWKHCRTLFEERQYSVGNQGLDYGVRTNLLALAPKGEETQTPVTDIRSEMDLGMLWCAEVFL